MGRASRRKRERAEQQQQLLRKEQWVHLSLAPVDPTASAMKNLWNTHKHKLSVREQLEVVAESYPDLILKANNDEVKGAVLCLEARDGFNIFFGSLDHLEEKKHLDSELFQELLEHINSYTPQTEIVVGYINDKEESASMVTTMDDLKRYEQAL